MRPVLVALVVTAGVAVAASPDAQASRVAVSTFDGDRTGDIQDVVIEVLESDHSVIDRRKVTKAIERLGIDDVDNNKALGKIAAELDADAVVVGEVEPDGSKSKLVIRVYVRSSKRAFKMTTRFSKASQIRESELRSMMRKLLDGDDSVLKDKDKDRDRDRDRDRDDDRDRDRETNGDDRDRDRETNGDDRDRDRDRETNGDDRDRDRDRETNGDDRERDDDRGDGDDDRGDRDDGDDKRGRRGKRTARGGDDRDDRDDRDDDDGISASLSGAAARPARKAAIRIEAGVSGTGRKLSFIYNANLDETTAPPGYTSNLVPGARVSAEIYPLALSDRDSAAAGFGIAAELDQAIGLTTTSSLAPDMPLTTTSRKFGVGVRYRLAYGTSPTNPSFTIGVGYGQRKFTVDRGPLMGQTLDMPNVVYKYIDPFFGVRVPIHPSAAISASGRFLAMRSTGSIGEQDQYGLAKVTGVDIEAGMEFQLGKFFLVHFSGVFTQVGYAFAPPGGDLANNRDGDPDDQDVGGARDRYFGGNVTIGAVY